MVNNISHRSDYRSFQQAYAETRQKIVERGDLPDASVSTQLDVLDQLVSFPFGKFVFERKGANGFWTDFIIHHAPTNRGGEMQLESFYYDLCPVVLAHRDRFRIFQRETQRRMKDGAVLASVPCGLMRDLLTLDYSGIENFRLIGIDLDPESLELAGQLAVECGLNEHTELREADAWNMNFNAELDIINSSGLNVYEPDSSRVQALYREFFRALRPGGTLITSVLTYPPGEQHKSAWDLQKISPETLLLDRIVHRHILNIRWRNFMTENEIVPLFQSLGFDAVSVHFDHLRVFPTVVAQKPA